MPGIYNESVNPLDGVRSFDWDAGNLTKNEVAHGVTKEEAEQVFTRPVVVADDLRHSAKEPRWNAFGKTDAGRLLALAFTRRGENLRIISARDQSRRERKRYA